MLASRVLESQLFGVSRLDPGAFAGVLLVLVVAGIAASALPARRATRINPVKVLHAD
jgi:ABC-type antimicrobial peptide transport system permease subunit